MAGTCFLSGVRLDDGNPLHRSRVRTWRGREVLVCLAVANVIDDGRASRAQVETFAERLRERERNEGRVHLAPHEDGGRTWRPDRVA